MRPRPPESNISMFPDLREALLTHDAATLLDDERLAAVARVIYRDQSLFRLYALGLEDLIRRGFQILGRTALECCVDAEARPVAKMVRTVWQRNHGVAPAAVVDPFAGSANLLYWVADAVGATGVGIESDPGVFAATSHNLALLGADVHLTNADHTQLAGGDVVGSAGSAPGRVYLLDPPWAAGYDPVHGLDLTRTSPPVDELLVWLRDTATAGEHLVVLKVAEHLSTRSRQWLRNLRGLQAAERISLRAPTVRTAFLVFKMT